MLAITQPLRVGDWVTFDDQYGVVEDVRLNYTVVRTPADARLLIPNEKLASGIIRNDTLDQPAVGLDVALWLPHGADAARAVDGAGRGDRRARSRSPRRRRRASGSPSAAIRCRRPSAPRHEAELRLRCLRRLQAEGLLAADRSSAPRGETAPGLH